MSGLDIRGFSLLAHSVSEQATRFDDVLCNPRQNCHKKTELKIAVIATFELFELNGRLARLEHYITRTHQE